MAHLANLAQICHGFGKYSKWMPKVAPVERGDYDENGESDENSESPDLLSIAKMASLVKNGQKVGEKLNNL